MLYSYDEPFEVYGELLQVVNNNLIDPWHLSKMTSTEISILSYLISSFGYSVSDPIYPRREKFRQKFLIQSTKYLGLVNLFILNNLDERLKAVLNRKIMRL